MSNSVDSLTFGNFMTEISTDSSERQLRTAKLTEIRLLEASKFKTDLNAKCYLIVRIDCIKFETKLQTRT